MRREALQVEKSALLKDLKGINPKLSTYAKIIKRIKEIDEILKQYEPVIQKEEGSRVPAV